MKLHGNQVVLPMNFARIMDENALVFKVTQLLGEFEELFIDGTKTEANANRYTFVWAKAIEKRLKSSISSPAFKG